MLKYKIFLILFIIILIKNVIGTIIGIGSSSINLLQGNSNRNSRECSAATQGQPTPTSTTPTSAIKISNNSMSPIPPNAPSSPNLEKKPQRSAATSPS